MNNQINLNTCKLNKTGKKIALQNRLLYIDNIRWFVIILVVIMHLNVTYSSTGLWYYKEPRELSALSTLIFAVYGSFNSAYMMSFLFLIAGYFAPNSLDKKGIVCYVRERLIRLGIPTLTYMLLIHPITILILGTLNHNLPSDVLSWYSKYLTSLSFISNSGPLWFAFALLIFSMIYALFHHLSMSSTKISNQVRPIIIKHTYIISIIISISVITFLIRIVQPSGISLFNNYIGNFMQIGDFSSYIIFFILGIIAYRKNLLAIIPYKFGILWFKLALIIGIPLWFMIIISAKLFMNSSAIFGGLNWLSAAYSTWQSFFGVGISLGLLVIFREKYNNHSKLNSFLSENAFGVYVFHAPILVAITITVRGIVINPLIKMYTVALIVLPVCFVFSHLIRKIPLIKKIFS